MCRGLALRCLRLRSSLNLPQSQTPRCCSSRIKSIVFLARVTVLENKPEVIPAGLILDLNSRIDEVDTRIDKLKFRIQGNTGKSIGHVHSISLTVTPE
jgi:hypothetical protein